MPTEMRQQHGTTRRGRLQRLLAASACVGFCLAAAACSSQPGTVIGTRSGPAASSGGATSPDGALAAIFSRLDGQLAEADAVPDMHPAALSPQSPEYLNLQPVVVAERMRALNALGASLID